MPRKRSGVHRAAPESDYEALAKIFGVMGHNVRLELLRALGEAPCDVSTLARIVELDISTVSYHLKPLREQCLVVHRDVDRRHLYRLADGLRIETRDGGFFLTVPADKTVRLRCGGPTTGSEGAGGRHEADSRAPGAGMGAPVLPGAVASFTVKLPPLSGKLPHSENRKRQSS